WASTRRAASASGRSAWARAHKRRSTARARSARACTCTCWASTRASIRSSSSTSSRASRATTYPTTTSEVHSGPDEGRDFVRRVRLRDLGAAGGAELDARGLPRGERLLDLPRARCGRDRAERPAARGRGAVHALERRDAVSRQRQAHVLLDPK